MFHVKHFVENQGTITWWKSLNCREIMVYLSISRKVKYYTKTDIICEYDLAESGQKWFGERTINDEK